MNWKIYDFRPLDKNTLKGIFTLQVGPIAIEGLMLHRKNGKEWVNFPSREYQKDGERKYAHFIRIPDKDSYWRFQKWCVSELKQYLTVEPKPISEIEDDIPF